MTLDVTQLLLETKNIMSGQLLLMSLDKVAKEKDELRDSNLHLQHLLNDLRVSRRALKESLIICTHRTTMAKKIK